VSTARGRAQRGMARLRGIRKKSGARGRKEDSAKAVKIRPQMPYCSKRWTIDSHMKTLFL